MPAAVAFWMNARALPAAIVSVPVWIALLPTNPPAEADEGVTIAEIATMKHSAMARL